MENQTQQYSMPQPQQPLPNGTATLVLGIVSIVGCFCYGIIGLICGIIAIVLGNKAVKLYKENPDAYTPSSFSNAKAGKICGIIGVSLSALFLIYVIIVIATLGTAFLSNPNAFINQMK